MTREEAKKLLGENATDEQVNALLNKVHENDSAYKKQIEDLKTQNSRYSDYDTIKQQLDEINKAKMTEQERLDAREKEIVEKERSVNRLYNTAKAKEILASYNVSNELLESIISDDAEKTIKNASNLASQIDAIKEATEKATKESLMNVNATPDVKDATTSDVMTWDKFQTLSSEEQNKFATEHPEEFNRL